MALLMANKAFLPSKEAAVFEVLFAAEIVAIENNKATKKNFPTAIPDYVQRP